MAAINADPVVMEFFPAIQSHEQTEKFVARMQQQLTDKGFCYFAVDKLESSEFIGFIGLSWQTYEAGFTPCIDIGWRLSRKEWNNGYATEGARKCISYALHELEIEKIYAIAPKINLRSERVMKKAGMGKIGEFIHPLLLADERLKDCIVYGITR
jgi:RimJ/RimL family protein N-acetyltransferase